MDANVDMQLAVALFECGFPEARVKQALQHCCTLTGAIEWLEANGGGVNGAAPRPAKAARVSPAADGAPPLPEAIIFSTIPSPSLDNLSPTADSCLVGTAIGMPKIIAIEARDASKWWRKAQIIWRSAVALHAQHDGGVTQTPSATAEDVPAEDEDEEDDCDEEGEEGEEEEDGEEEQPSVLATGDEFEPSEGQATEATDAATASETARVDGSMGSFTPIQSGKKRSSKTPKHSPGGMRLSQEEEMCSICCNDVLPGAAVRLACSHGWYCAQCVLRHAEARLSTGASSITCPECCGALAERDLRKMLPPELIERLLSRSLEQAVSSAADLWACPTPNCPMRVALEDGELPRLHCSICKKTACLRCGIQPWHRGLTCAESRSRRGVAKRRRDDGTSGLMKWIEDTGSKQCPTCRMAVTKQNLTRQQTQYSECHKMFCRNCNTRFCFKCLAVLTDSFTCGCSINAHGFIDPISGKRMNHLRQRGRPKAQANKAKAKAKAKVKNR